jgi:hypothetical protein
MRSSSLVRALVLCVLAAAPAYGQEAVPAEPRAPRPGELAPVEAPTPGILFAVERDLPIAGAGSLDQSAPTITPLEPPADRRPRAMVPLYSSLVTLNALDVHSTLTGLSTGHAREANPIMRPFVERPAAFIAVKAGLTAATIWMSEKSRKKHPKRALVALIVSNVAMAAVVAHNYRVARR